jgi:RimJ/RimL family protein N-acetyltransferase
MIELIPIKKNLDENSTFILDSTTTLILEMTVAFYDRIGYNLPWIGYFVTQHGKVVGSAGFKGKPVDNTVEIAYGTHPDFQHKGIGTFICKALVELASSTDPSLRVTARTLPEENFSVKILRKNNFKFIGTKLDPEDGDVWEWLHIKP